jgi:predicted nucleic acid-binding protein
MQLLDTSALASLFLNHAHSARAASWAAGNKDIVAISDWASAELSGVVSRYARANAIDGGAALRILTQFDDWRPAVTQHPLSGPAAVSLAETFVRDFSTKLSAADAMHLAIARLNAATLVTFDERQAAAAALLGVACIVPP